jgi:glycosyltransferase involved in cell wall biosynthesis
MVPRPKISVITPSFNQGSYLERTICTRKRGNDLRRTLETIGELDVPSDLPAGVLVVDNGSTDHTPEVVHHIKMLRMPVRCVHEPRKGKGYAYNTGLAETKGDFFFLRMMTSDHRQIGLTGCVVQY